MLTAVHPAALDALCLLGQRLQGDGSGLRGVIQQFARSGSLAPLLTLSIMFSMAAHGQVRKGAPFPITLLLVSGEGANAVKPFVTTYFACGEG